MDAVTSETTMKTLFPTLPERGETIFENIGYRRFPYIYTEGMELAVIRTTKERNAPDPDRILSELLKVFPEKSELLLKTYNACITSGYSAVV